MPDLVPDSGSSALPSPALPSNSPTPMLPPIPAVVPVTAPVVDSTVAKDIMSDAKNEPRSSEPTPPPPGTEKTKFWQNAATKGALVASVTLFNSWWRPLVTATMGAEFAIGLEFVEWAWLAAFGIQKMDVNAIRWK